MAFAGKVWRLLVGIKDGLGLIFLLLFFSLLYSVLTASPSPAQVRDGALLLDLDGIVVEEKSVVDPVDALLSGQQPIAEFQIRDLVHALDTAAADERITSVVFDLSSLIGGGQVHMQALGEAIERVKAADKPVLTYAISYTDDAMKIAAHASEAWVDPLGGAFIAGPGGSRLYFGELLENLKINARVYRVGTYKSAVEPYLRSGMSPEARENAEALYGALWEEWQANVSKARPGLDLDLVTKTPAEWIAANEGDLATAALEAGLVDKLGSRTEFGDRVAELSGKDEWDKTPGAYTSTPLDAWLADNPVEEDGDAIAVVTIAGVIVDGDAGPGTAGGDRIAGLLDDALEQEPKGLIIRVDSPGGSVLASEEIRRAVLRHKAKDIPIAVSMANVAASGGYWVATPADRIFAEPETITGSIGIFAVIPTFENAAAEWGINGDGVNTTPLSGQPNLVAGFTPEVDAILQSVIEDGYSDFLTRVAEARGMTAAQVDAVGQGRVWDGGTARQIGLVDQYGGIEDAAEWVAKEAGLAEGEWYLDYLASAPGEYDNLLRALMSGDAPPARNGDMFAMVSGRQQAIIAQAQADFELLTSGRGMQAYCLECPGVAPARVHADARQGWFARLAAAFIG
ncbi:signal peptide peptidase SppA [Pontixanthobacter sp.]|uniref:signal peptide peptidase SppA n=1 Tax=Pontixanthobacter sp. TaxID=2792078 RepID=UPI003C7E36E1